MANQLKDFLQRIYRPCQFSCWYLKSPPLHINNCLLLLIGSKLVFFMTVKCFMPSKDKQTFSIYRKCPFNYLLFSGHYSWTFYFCVYLILEIKVCDMKNVSNYDYLCHQISNVKWAYYIEKGNLTKKWKISHTANISYFL